MSTQTVAAALRQATSVLTGAGVASPRLDAEVLLAHVLEIERDRLFFQTADILAPGAAARFASILARRARHEPVAYITGVREFWSLPFRVTPATLIPRPDSETLIEAARALFASNPPATVLDLGTGSGCLLLAALSEFPDATGLGVDRSAEALAVARDNARDLGLAGRARFVAGDWNAMSVPERFDLILCNPPYISATDMAQLAPDVRDHEPHDALSDYADGLGAYRLLLPRLGHWLAADGVALIELGTGQAAAVGALAQAAGFSAGIREDLANIERCMILRQEPDRF